MDGSKFRFTRQRIDGLPLPNGHHKDGSTVKVFYYDTDCSVLGIRVSSNGNKSFIAYQWSHAKKRTERIVIGKYQADAIQPVEFEKNPLSVMGKNRGLNVDHARKLALATIGSGRDFGKERKTWSEELTLGELFDEYVSRHMEKSRKTTEATKKNFERDFANKKKGGRDWSDRKLSTITHHDCEELHSAMGKKQGPYVANRRIQLLRAMFNKAQAWKLYPGDNPATGISLFPEKPRERFLTDDEAIRLRKVLESEPQEDIKDFIMLALLTGARKSNVLAMHWDNIDLTAGTWTIPDTKNGTAQLIKLGAREISILARRQRPDLEGAFVFPGSGKTGHLMDPKKPWYKLRKEAKIPDVTIHDLRRSLGAAMANANVSVALIKANLNHKDQKTTLAVYAKTNKDAERDARELATSKWFVEEKPDNVVALPAKKAQ